MSDPLVEVVVGTRPNFVKATALLRALAAARAPISLRIVHTGQHHDPALSGRFHEALGMPAPDVQLHVGSGPHGAQLAKLVSRYEEHLVSARPRPAAVVVIGDVNSTLAAAIVAAKLGISVVHLEAGLRSFDRSMPEEINRVVADALSDVLLASEPSGVVNLRAEGVGADRIHMIGSLTIDSLLHELEAARSRAAYRDHGLAPGEYVYATLHRPSNVDDGARLSEVVRLLRRIAEHAPVVLPMHPRTAGRLAAHRGPEKLGPRVHVLPPLPYREAVSLLDGAAAVITDSGGIQEEASQLGVPCITLRTTTERPATVALGTNVVCGGDLQTAEHLALEALASSTRAPASVPGWDGRAAERAVEVLVRKYAQS